MSWDQLLQSIFCFLLLLPCSTISNFQRTPKDASKGSPERSEAIHFVRVSESFFRDLWIWRHWCLYRVQTLQGNTLQKCLQTNSVKESFLELIVPEVHSYFKRPVWQSCNFLMQLETIQIKYLSVDPTVFLCAFWILFVHFHLFYLTFLCSLWNLDISA